MSYKLFNPILGWLKKAVFQRREGGVWMAYLSPLPNISETKVDININLKAKLIDFKYEKN